MQQLKYNHVILLAMLGNIKVVLSVLTVWQIVIIVILQLVKNAHQDILITLLLINVFI